METIAFGQYSFPVILSFILGMVWKYYTTNTDRWKPLIAVGCGAGLSIVYMFYANVDLSFKNIIDYLIFGCLQGAAAIGIYELQRGFRNPRS